MSVKYIIYVRIKKFLKIVTISIKSRKGNKSIFLFFWVIGNLPNIESSKLSYPKSWQRWYFDFLHDRRATYLVWSVQILRVILMKKKNYVIVHELSISIDETARTSRRPFRCAINLIIILYVPIAWHLGTTDRCGSGSWTPLRAFVRTRYDEFSRKRQFSINYSHLRCGSFLFS